MTENSDEARDVLVFVADDDDGDPKNGAESPETKRGTLSAADIEEWLSIVGPVEHVRLQYDAVSQRSCFRVCFRRAAAARHAAQFLDGVRLKSCPVRIQSSVYKKGDEALSAVTHTADSNGRSTTAESETAAAAASAHLPFNHLIPPSLRMDGELVELLSPSRVRADANDSSSPDFVRQAEALRHSQQVLRELLLKIELTQERIKAVDRDIEAARRQQLVAALSLRSADATDCVEPSPSPTEQRKAHERADAAPRAVRTATPIPSANCSPSALVSFVSQRYGPISWCHCLVDTSNDEEVYYLSLAFMMPEDCQSFLEFASEGTVDESHAKRPRAEADSDDPGAANARSILRSLRWIAQ